MKAYKPQIPLAEFHHSQLLARVQFQGKTHYCTVYYGKHFPNMWTHEFSFDTEQPLGMVEWMLYNKKGTLLGSGEFYPGGAPPPHNRGAKLIVRFAQNIHVG